LDAGAQVTLVSAPTSLTPPVGTRVVSVSTAQEMLEAVLAEFSGAEALLMAAAVADFRPNTVAGEKLKKRDGIPRLELEAVPDILSAVTNLQFKKPRVVVGFAAESRDLLENAEVKLASKKLDMIVANDISSTDAGFGVDTNRVTLLFPDGRKEKLPLAGKAEIAEEIIERLAVLLEN